MARKQGSLGRSTTGVRAGESRTPLGEHSPPIFATSSFCFDSAQHAAAVFAERRPGPIYSRFTNPTVEAFETRLAALEGGDRCIATASGMAAILSVCLTFLKPGDRILAGRTLFGSTISLFDNVLARHGLRTEYLDLADAGAWRAAASRDVGLLFVETPSNPLGEIADLRVLSRVARDCGALLVVDNCFLTPVQQRPLELGADLVVHSATKLIDGQGRCVGGAVVGDADRVGRDLFAFMRTAGPCLSPFNAWVFLKGLETLAIRVKAQSDAALRLARWLQQRREVRSVHYAGLPEHPQHRLAQRQQDGYGTVVAFDMRGGRRAAFRLVNRLKLFSITANLGDVRSTVTHPATTTHHRMGVAARRRAGIGDGLVRIAVGLEDAADLEADLGAALKA